MIHTLAGAVGVALIFGLTFLPWRFMYPDSDWAVVFLAPLTVLLFLSSFWINVAIYRANARVAVRTDSPIAWLMTGRIRAMIVGIGFSILTVYVLAWHAVSSTYIELCLLILLSVAASLFFAFAEHKLLIHLTPPFARATALSAATLIAAAVFIPILASANWNFTPHPGAIRTANLESALQLGFDELPARRGWVAELLAPLYALEYGKLWFAVQDGSPKWLALWYSLDSALVSVLAARASCILMSLPTSRVKEIDARNLTA